MHHQHKDVVIIGAGLSGLVCVYRLRQLDVDALLVERSSRVGGVIESEQKDGFLIERGPNSARGTAEVVALVDELGIQEELVEGNPRAPAYVFFNGRLRPVPMNPPALIKSDLLSAGGKLRLLREPFIKRRSSEEEESVAGFISRRLGRQIAERLVAPFVSGIYAGDEKQLSIQAAFPQMADLERDYGSLFRGALAKLREAKQSIRPEPDQQKPKTRRSISFRSGMSTLTEALAERLGDRLLLNSQCRLGPRESAAVEPTISGFRLRIERQGVEEAVTCKHLVIATPAYTATTFVKELSGEIGELLAEINYPPLAIVHLAYEESDIEVSLDGFGFLAVPSEGLKILGCVFNSSQFPNRAPEGRALMTVFIGGARNPELVQLPDEALAAAAHEELQDILGIASAPRVLSVTRWQHSIPQYNIGHAARVRKIEKGVAAIAGLTIIGNYLHGVSVGDCIKEAEQAAARIYKGIRQ